MAKLTAEQTKLHNRIQKKLAATRQDIVALELTIPGQSEPRDPNLEAADWAILGCMTNLGRWERMRLDGIARRDIAMLHDVTGAA